MELLIELYYFRFLIIWSSIFIIKIKEKLIIDLYTEFSN